MQSKDEFFLKEGHRRNFSFTKPRLTENFSLSIMAHRMERAWRALKRGDSQESWSKVLKERGIVERS